MFWWKQIAALKNELGSLQEQLRKEENDSTRLTGFIRRLQPFGVTPAGYAPQREFAEALLDCLHTMLQCQELLLLRADPETLDWVPLAARGFAPEALARLRVRAADKDIGRAAQSMKIVVNGQTDFMAAPNLLVPLLSQGHSIGLLVLGKPKDGSFSAEDRECASLFAAQAALTLEDHAFHGNLVSFQDQLVDALLRSLDAKDSVSHRHSNRTRALVRVVASEIPLPEFLIRQIEYGACLHDIGKIGIEDAILKKPAVLTPQEYTTMKEHPAIGHRILQSIPAFRTVGAIVLYHQEWYNGAGYPEGLAGEEIPYGARIVQIIDAWDAMTSDRPYRKAMSKSAAMAELRRQAGAQFDPKLVDLFIRVLDRLEREGIPTTEHSAPAVAAG